MYDNCRQLLNRFLTYDHVSDLKLDFLLSIALSCSWLSKTNKRTWTVPQEIRLACVENRSNKKQLQNWHYIIKKLRNHIAATRKDNEIILNEETLSLGKDWSFSFILLLLFRFYDYKHAFYISCILKLWNRPIFLIEVWGRPFDIFVRAFEDLCPDTDW